MLASSFLAFVVGVVAGYFLCVYKHVALVNEYQMLKNDLAFWEERVKSAEAQLLASYHSKIADIKTRLAELEHLLGLNKNS